MRRRRKRLEVSTFPFLAVLLCAMGSLILVLLVMDRKAKMAARFKAEAVVARAADEAEQKAAARRAEIERHLQETRAEWEKKREALHTKLLTEQQALQLEVQQLHEKMTLAAARLRLEQEHSGELKNQIEAGRGKVQGEATALATTKQALADSEKRTEQEKAALARMTNDLVVLERALKDLKETRERERQTYSVVPYNGKRGESRRPLYIECVKDGVIFHPDKKPVHVFGQEAEVRTEVARRFARQREQLAAAKMPIEQTPFLMLLVRPDGISSYYAFEAALADFDVQFGYELIDADWLLDFPEDYQPGTQPWQILAKQTDLPPLDRTKPGVGSVHGVQLGKGQAGTQSPISSGEGSVVARSPDRATAPDRRSPEARGDLRSEQVARSGDRATTGMNRDNSLPANGLGQPVPVGDGPGNNGGADRGSPASSSLPPTPLWETIATGTPLPSSTPRRDYRSGPPGNSEANRDGNREAPPNSSPLAQGSDSPVTSTPGPALPPLPPTEMVRPSVSSAVGSNQGNGFASTGTAPNGTPTAGDSPTATPMDSGEPGTGTAEIGLRRLPVRSAEPKRPPPHVARLNGDRDYLIFIECKTDSVVLYPAGREFPLTALTGGANNPLVQAVQQMIERKQSGVKPGEIAYRPQVRFLVRSETLRAYHLVYPLFNALPIAKTRQDLIPEDDVRSIIAGN